MQDNIVFNEWMKTPDIRSNVPLDAFVVMPNHIHGIIVITEMDVSQMGVCGTPLRSPSNTVGQLCGDTNPPLQNKLDIPFGNAIIGNTLYELPKIE